MVVDDVNASAVVILLNEGELVRFFILIGRQSCELDFPMNRLELWFQLCKPDIERA